MSGHSCPMCADFSAPTFQLLVGHIQRVHSQSSSFQVTCGYDGCMRTLRSIEALKKHLARNHKKKIEVTGTNSLLPDDEAPPSMDDRHGLDDPEVTNDTQSRDQVRKENCALWILKLKETRALTQASVNCVLKDVTTLCTSTVAELGSQVALKLHQNGVSMADIPGLQQLFSSESPYARPFDGLDTYYRQVAFFKEHFKLVEPVQVELGKTRTWRTCGEKRLVVEKVEAFMYIPILKVIERMLQNSVILQEVKCGHVRQDLLLEDFCDGKKAKAHPLFSIDVSALQIILYYDELELCNPIGDARTKHKIGCFYFTLGNVHPRYRSAVRAIQLVALVKAVHVKEYGLHHILQYIVDDICKLEQGVDMETCEGLMTMKGTIATFPADNLGSHAVGGFKEGGSALRPCRHCWGSATEIKEKLREVQFELRTPEEHDRICELLGTSLSDPYHTTTYGVNSTSPLNSLQHYHVCDYGLPPDIMHDVLEGYVPYTLKMMLNVFIRVRCYLTLAEVNSCIKNLRYGYSVTDRPRPLTEAALSTMDSKTALKQSASRTWTLARLLPVMIGHLIPEDDPYWHHYLGLLDIMEIIFSPRLHMDTPAHLLVLIETNLGEFKSLYPSATIIPKLHYLLHLPRYIENAGPLVRHWTMRFEAKHQYFKKLASTMGNYINVCYSLAMRHQCYQCYFLNDEEAYTNTTEVGPGETISMESTEFRTQLVLTVQTSRVYRATWVKSGGMLLKKGGVVVTASNQDHPEFAQIVEIFVVNPQNVVLGLNAMEVLDYSEHYHSWIVQKSLTSCVMNVNKLCSLQVLQPRSIHNCMETVKALTLKYSIV